MSPMEYQPNEEATTELIIKSIVSLSINHDDRDGWRILDGISVCMRVSPIPTDTVRYSPSVRDKYTWIPIISNPSHNL